MRFLARLMLLAIAFAVCALPAYGQAAKPKQTEPTPTAAVPETSEVESNPSNWKEFSSTCGRFTALFPGIPTVTDNSNDTGLCDAQAYTVKTSVEYMVFFKDFVVDLEKDPKEFNRAFDSMRDYTIAASKGKVLDETAISIAGNRGRVMRITGPDERLMTVKAFAVAKRFYLLSVTIPAETPNAIRVNEPWVKKFFDSFKVTP